MGFLGDLFSKTPEQKQEILQKSITNHAISAMAKASTQTSGSINAVQRYVQRAHSKSVGVVVTQIASINISALQSADVNAEMLNNMKQKIKSELTKSKSDFPEFTKSGASQTIDNIVEKNVDVFASAESIMNASIDINLEQEIVLDEYAESVGATFTQEGKGALAVANKIGAGIVSDLVDNLDIAAASEDDTTNFIGDVIRSISEPIGASMGNGRAGHRYSDNWFFLHYWYAFVLVG